MISTAFINCDSETVYSANFGYKIVKECEEITESVMKAIHDYESHLDKYTFESSISGIEDEDELLALEAEGDNIFKKIGESVLKLIDKLIKMVQGFVDKLRSNGFAKKSEMDKIEVMCKKHPELKEQIIGHASDFDFSQIRSIADMEENYNKIIKMTDKTKKKEAIDKFKKGATATVAVAAGTGTVIKLGEALVRLKNSHKEMTEKCQFTIEKKQDRLNTLRKEMSKLDDKVRSRAREGLPRKAAGVYHDRFDIGDRTRATWLNSTEKRLYDDMQNEVNLLSSQISHLNNEFNQFNNQQNGILKKIMQVMKGFSSTKTN